MRLTILSSHDPEKDRELNDYLFRLEEGLSLEHRVTGFRLRNMNIKPCRGCFGCWQKTPGKCFQKDDMEQVCTEYIQSDLALLISPLVVGFTNWVLKQALERLLPLIHPYVEINSGRLRHAPRYEKYPRLGLLLAPEAETDDEDLALVTGMYERIGENHHAPLVYSALTHQKSPLEVAHEIGHCQRIA